MNNKKKTSGFAKIRKLITVLEKCNGKDAIGGKDALISPKAVKIFAVIGLALLMGALFTAAYLLAPMIVLFIPIEAITRSLMLILLLVSFILSVKNIVSVLYTADDLPVLLPMPFSGGQIVSAKLAVASKFSVGLSFVLINSLCLGMGIRAQMGAAYVIGTVLSSLLIPVTGIALATLLVVVVFRVFGFIRNRDVTVVLGGVFTIAMTVAYIFANNSLNRGDSEAAAAVFSTVASASSGFPNISYMADFMSGGNIVGLFISIGSTLAVIALALLAIKLFYIPTALSMQTTGSKNKAVKKDSIGNRKASALKALTSYEAKNTRRNPAYLVYGFAMSFLWPILMILPTVLGNNSIVSGFRTPMDTRAAVICALAAGVTASCFACGFNVLAVSAFSREGSTYAALSALPIEFRDYYRSKRNYSLLICSLGSVLYLVILGIVCAAMGFLSPADSWVILYSAGISFLLNLILINCMLLKNAKKPYFDWDSETEISRKLSWINVVAIVVGVIALIFLFAALILSSTLGMPGGLLDSDTVTTVTIIVSSAFAALALVGAIWVNRISPKKAETYLKEYEA